MEVLSESDMPDSTDEMKMMESRQAAVTLLQIKNHDPSKFSVINKPENEPQIIFNSVSGDRPVEALHCNPLLDILFDKAVAQRLGEETHSPKSIKSERSVHDNDFEQNIEVKMEDAGICEEKEVDLSKRKIHYSSIDNNIHSNKRAIDSFLLSKVKQCEEMTRSNSKDFQMPYDDASQSSSGSDPDRLQMDISQVRIIPI